MGPRWSESVFLKPNQNNRRCEEETEGIHAGPTQKRSGGPRISCGPVEWGRVTVSGIKGKGGPSRLG